MFSDVFLAMTAGEMEGYLPKKAAYMACHFSPYSKGLSNLPTVLPPDSLLLLDDSTLPDGHDPETAAQQLTELVSRFSVKAVLLDFQNERTVESQKMVSSLVQALPCPVAVTKVYAKDFHCPVFLSPPPVNMPLNAYLSPWLQQGVFLEIAPEGLCITVTEKGSTALSLPPMQGLPLHDSRLHCHYNVEVSTGKAVFTLSRTKEDLTALAAQACELGALGAVGLYQELSRL